MYSQQRFSNYGKLFFLVTLYLGYHTTSFHQTCPLFQPKNFCLGRFFSLYKCLDFWLSFQNAFGNFNHTKLQKKNSTTFFKKYIIILSLSETKNKHMNSAANLWNVSQNCRNIHDSSFSLCQWLPQWADNESITENNKYEWAHKNEDDYRTGHRLYTMCTTYANFNNVCF
jgi:hypothetical protein